MNANELADFVEISKPDDKAHQLIATMLRQQQTEIDALKQIIDANNLNHNIGQFVKPAKYTDAWWKEVEEFNKQLKEQNEQ